MSTPPTLLILAAGMGSRYGGLKQLDAIGPGGETILEYSVFDAHRAGFGKVVFVIREDFAEAFREKVMSRFEGVIPVETVFQKRDDLPDGCTCPKEREKPWGTAHAVYAARDAVAEPFAVINADDFYGAEAFRLLAGFLRSETVKDASTCAMVGYRLGNTLSDHGTVSRGICHVQSDGQLQGITEYRKLHRRSPNSCEVVDDETGEVFPAPTLVSMNCFGLGTAIFAEIEAGLRSFFDGASDAADPLKGEVYLPAVVTAAVAGGHASVRVLGSDARWLGVTYREDKDRVCREIAALVRSGAYPSSLWS